MKTEDIAVLGLAGVAVYLILKTGGAFNPAQPPLQVSPQSYSYHGDIDGMLFSATGADVRARR